MQNDSKYTKASFFGDFDDSLALLVTQAPIDHPNRRFCANNNDDDNRHSYKPIASSLAHARGVIDRLGMTC